MLQINIPDRLTKYNYKDILESSEIDRHKKYERPIPVFEREVDILTRGNVSMIQGKAKSRKTFSILYILSYILKVDKINSVVLFDTEQFTYHSSVFFKRLQLMNEDDSKFKLFNLRRYSKDLRLQFIEDYIIEYKPDLVFIDNIRDVISDFNDISQADNITTLLSQLSEEYGSHICCTLHMNKSDGNARGHLGAELTQKSETVFNVETDDNEITTISGAYCRNKKFENFSFFIQNGIPVSETKDIVIKKIEYEF